MALADKGIEKLTAAAQAHIGDGEKVEVAVMAMGRNPYLLAGGLLGVLLGKMRVLAVTDQQLWLLEPDKKSIKTERFTGTIGSYPRDTPIGDVKGLNAKLVFPDGEKAYVSKVFHKQLAAALG